MDLDTARYWLEKATEDQSTVIVKNDDLLAAIRKILDRHDEIEDALLRTYETIKTLGKVL